MDNKIYLTRLWEDDERCMGVLRLNDTYVYTLELPYQDNKTNVSSIPAGDYTIRKTNNIIKVNNTEGRSGIQIHEGNYPKDIRGCILVGEKIGLLHGKICVLDSRAALRRLKYAIEDNKEYSFNIVCAYHNNVGGVQFDRRTSTIV